jgi:hypothetical protein
MEWWRMNGWALVEGTKPSIEGLFIPEHIQLDSSEFEPTLLAVQPARTKHRAWDVGNNQVLVLYSLERCEQLYQRKIKIENQ